LHYKGKKATKRDKTKEGNIKETQKFKQQKLIKKIAEYLLI
jgi:hypothetical protein